MTSPQHVLIVEDDASIGPAMQSALQSHGFEATLHTRGADVAQFVLSSKPDLVLLDAGLPDLNGFTLCRTLRQLSRDTPIIIVTALDADIDIVVGLDAGADDYITKPFSMAVLLARVRARLRVSDAVDPDAPMNFGELSIHPAAYTVTVSSVPVDLRPREFQLLVYLARNAGRVVPRVRLLADVWDVHWESSSKTLDMHLLALRRKLGSSVEIVTVRGVGYRLVAP
ncbi:MAG TPA: response regulator transcription factor [Ilumatobacteraceae bacterium]|jgi:DNA-binding response OmpR family regulator